MIKKRKNIIIVILFLIVLLGISVLFFWKKNISNTKNNINTHQKEKTISKTEQLKQSKELLSNLEKNRWKFVNIDWLDLFVDIDFSSWFYNKNFWIKKSINNMINKIKWLWINNKNSFIAIGDHNPISWMHSITIKVQDKEKVKDINNTIKNTKKEIQKKFNTKERKKYWNILEENLKNTKAKFMNEDYNEYCLWWTELKTDTASVVMCPDHATLMKLMKDNKELVELDKPTLDVYTKMKDALQRDLTYKEITSFNTILFKYPFLIDKQKDFFTNKKYLNYYKDMVKLFEMTQDKTLTKEWIQKVVKWFFITKKEDKIKYNKTEQTLYNLLKKYIEQPIKNKKTIADILLIVNNNKKNKYNILLDIYESIRYNMYYANIKNENKITKEDEKNNIWVWFYVDVLNFVININIYNSDKYNILSSIIKPIINDKYKWLLNIWYVPNDKQSSVEVKPFLYDTKWGILQMPSGLSGVNFSKIWLKYIKNTQEFQNKINNPNLICQKINKIVKKDSKLSYLKYNLWCFGEKRIQNFIEKYMSKLTKRVSEMFSLLSKDPIELTKIKGYFLLLKIYPDVMYFRFSDSKIRWQFIEDFQDAYNVLKNTKKENLFELKMQKYYKYFSKVSDYNLLKQNFGNFVFVLYYQK